MGGGKMTFTYLFYKHIMFRHSCGVCHYTNTTRPSDITLADFWGWEKAVPGFNDDDKGVNLVILNTEKGKLLFEKVSKGLEVKKVNIDDCLQPNLQHPSIIHPKRMKFEDDYKRKGFDYVFQHDYNRPPFYRRIVSKCKKIFIALVNK